MPSAKTRKYDTTDKVKIPVESGTVKGDPIVVGGIKGVALADRDSDGNAVIQIVPRAVWYQSVLAATDDGSPNVASAVAVGDAIYKNDSSLLLSKDEDGTLFGHALAAIDSGETEVIPVLLAVG